MSELERSLEGKVRERAYALWEQNGYPEGLAHQHWEQAKQQIEANEQPEADPAEPIIGSEQPSPAGTA